MLSGGLKVYFLLLNKFSLNSGKFIASEYDHHFFLCAPKLISAFADSSSAYLYQFQESGLNQSSTAYWYGF